MKRGAVNLAHDRLQSGTKRAVAFAAAEPTLTSELLERQSAVRTGQILGIGVGLAGWPGSIRQTGQNLGQRKRDIVQRRMKTARRRTLLAERERDLLVIDDLRQMNLRFALLAVLTQHMVLTCLPSDRAAGRRPYADFPVASIRQLPVVCGDHESRAVLVVQAE